MIYEIIKLDVDQITEIGEHHIDIEVRIDKVMEEDHIIPMTIEVTIEETILEIHKITEVNILEKKKKLSEW